ncbi:hypothetical protein STEG23_029079, partial [Scotinomys teguina]
MTSYKIGPESPQIPGSYGASVGGPSYSVSVLVMVNDPSPLDGAIHIQTGSFLLSLSFLETPIDTPRVLKPEAQKTLKCKYFEGNIRSLPVVAVWLVDSSSPTWYPWPCFPKLRGSSIEHPFACRMEPFPGME